MATAKPPTKVQIGAVTYAVSLDLGRIPDDKYGYTEVGRQNIYIHPEQGPDQMADTLLHECLHGVWAQVALSSDAEEVIIRSLTPLLLDTLRRNPKLTAFLLP